MANKIYLTQQTNRHIAKRLDSDVNPAIYDSVSFGNYGVPGVTDTDLNFQQGIVTDPANNVYICDTKNHRIVKLDSDLAYVAKYDMFSTIGLPFAIMYDTINSELYVVGVHAHIYIRIERLTTALVSSKVSGNLHAMNELWYKPTSIVRGPTADSFLVGGVNLGLFSTVETGTFSTFTQIFIAGEVTQWPNLYAKTLYTGLVHHSVNDDLYLNDGKRILRASLPAFTNIGDSDFISETLTILKEGIGGTLLALDADNGKIVRYDEDLNFVEDIYISQLEIDYSTLSGIFLVGEEVRTPSPGFGKGRVVTDNGSNQMHITISRDSFKATDVVTGVESGAECTITGIVNPIAIDGVNIVDFVEVSI